MLTWGLSPEGDRNLSLCHRGLFAHNQPQLILKNRILRYHLLCWYTADYLV